MLLTKVLISVLTLLVLVWPTTIIPISRTSQVKSDGPTAKELFKILNNDMKVGGDYDMEADLPAKIPIYKLNGAFYWTADMSVDCDGITTPQCNHKTDSMYQDDTSLHTTLDQPLNAAMLPYIVLPLSSERWNYGVNGIKLGAVVAVIYKGQVRYGIFGDVGPPNIIGEVSYAMVRSFGINPNPNKNAVPRIAVTYIVWPNSKVVPVENHDAAVAEGQLLAAKLISDNTKK